MENPLVSIVIPTLDRPSLLPGAIESALAQTIRSIEVIVVDDGSRPPAKLMVADDRVRLIRKDRPGGVCVARNAGLEAARGTWVTFLDDDDRLLPHMLEVSLAAVRTSRLPPPIGAISGLEVALPSGEVREIRLPPPSMPRGSHFALEEIEPGRSYLTKQTLVAETNVLRSIGGFDERLRSRSGTELFLRLNPECSLVGIDTITYRLRRDGEEPNLSSNHGQRIVSAKYVLEKHKKLFAAHPRAHVAFLGELYREQLRNGDRSGAVVTAARSIRADPRRTGAWRELVRAVAGPRALRLWRSLRHQRAKRPML